VVVLTLLGAGAAWAAPSHMPQGAPVLAPAGYSDFCRRQPADCGLQTSGLTEVSLATPAPPRLGPGLWSRLNRVNAQVNRAIVARTDRDAFGLSDYWQTPLADGRGSGDCEDYVLEKIRALVAAGVPRSALNIALGLTPEGEMHAVLLVSTAEGDFVLDNRSAAVTAWASARYTWVSRQVDGQPHLWASATPFQLAAR